MGAVTRYCDDSLILEPWSKRVPRIHRLRKRKMSWKFYFILLYLFIYLFIGRTWVWTQGPMLAKQVLAKLVLYCLSHTSSPFWSGYFGDSMPYTVFPGWPWTEIFWISTPQVTRVIGMSHQCHTELRILSELRNTTFLNVLSNWEGHQ
jgi:hypothetical protein